MRAAWKISVGMVCLLVVPLGLASRRAVLRVEEARIGENGLVWLRWTGGQEIVMARDRDGYCEDAPRCEDAGASQLAISSNRRSVGWTANYNGCCQNYPVPWVLVIARDGRVVHQLMGPRPIFNWKFEKDDTLVAFFTDTSHGNMAPECELYETLTWKRVDEWYPGKSPKMPEWARPFAADMDSDGEEGAGGAKKSSTM